jgi:anti-anti-sigma factor
MKVKTKKDANTAVITPDKNVMIGSDASVIQNAILDVIQDDAKEVVIDLSKLDYITSWSVGSLFHALSTCRNRNVNFSLTGVNQKIHGILDNLNLLQVFTIKQK